MLLATERGGAPIAVLRLDGNFYDSHQDALYALYEAVPVGGYVIFDDIRSHVAVKEAWADFCKDQGIVEKLELVDDTDPNGAWFKKSRAVVVDHAKRRPNRDVNVVA